MKSDQIYKVLHAPHVSEKATICAEMHRQVVFKVAVNATKPEIKKAVEKLFDVKVDNVRVLNVKGKVKRNRYGLVKKPTWKKAYVQLAEGQDIDFTTA